MTQLNETVKKEQSTLVHVIQILCEIKENLLSFEIEGLLNLIAELESNVLQIEQLSSEEDFDLLRQVQSDILEIESAIEDQYHIEWFQIVRSRIAKSIYRHEGALV